MSKPITKGAFTAHDKNGTPVTIEWIKTTLFAPEFAEIMKAVWPMAGKTYAAPEVQFLRAFPDEVAKEDFYATLRPLFEHGIDKVDWTKVESMVRDSLKSHFVFDTSTWGPEVTAAFEKDVCYAITVKEPQSQTILGFSTFMVRPNYAAGDIKLMSWAVDEAHQNRGLDTLLVSSIFAINTDIKRISTCMRVTNAETIKTFKAWGFVHTENPIMDHPHNLNHWTFFEYKTTQSDILQKVVSTYETVK